MVGSREESMSIDCIKVAFLDDAVVVVVVVASESIIAQSLGEGVRHWGDKRRMAAI